MLAAARYYLTWGSDPPPPSTLTDAAAAMLQVLQWMVRVLVDFDELCRGRAQEAANSPPALRQTNKLRSDEANNAWHKFASTVGKLCM